MKSNYHNFHIVNVSPWPLFSACGALFLTEGAVLYIHNYILGSKLLIIGIIVIIMNMFFWWRDVIREATFEGRHTRRVINGLKIGMILFIVSEVMFFFGFFWAFFHSSLSPTVEIGCQWPPKGIIPFDPTKIPLLNTLLLLMSGSSITLAHYAILGNKRKYVIQGFNMTIVLALLFTLFQVIEYFTAPFSISDGIYGSTFYMLTGFHGFHVLIGTTFIIVCYIRFFKHHFTAKRHFGFQAASWYWHFVDVVWIFLYLTVYCWGSIKGPSIDVLSFKLN